jgi:hypothetical protein
MMSDIGNVRFRFALAVTPLVGVVPSLDPPQYLAISLLIIEPDVIPKLPCSQLSPDWSPSGEECGLHPMPDVSRVVGLPFAVSEE